MPIKDKDNKTPVTVKTFFIDADGKEVEVRIIWE